MHKFLAVLLLFMCVTLIPACANNAAQLELKFKAVDGSQVDLAKMRGKVVLVDFWATWCPPCRKETPTVVEAYKRFHDQGFEVVGISLDDDVDALKAFTTDNKMPWPQYFDGLGFDNKIAVQFGVDSLPTMWLVGKDGKRINTDPRVDLAEKVKKALEAKP